jgi:hypothetical protein
MPMLHKDGCQTNSLKIIFLSYDFVTKYITSTTKGNYNQNAKRMSSLCSIWNQNEKFILKRSYEYQKTKLTFWSSSAFLEHGKRTLQSKLLIQARKLHESYANRVFCTTHPLSPCLEKNEGTHHPTPVASRTNSKLLDSAAQQPA